MFLLRRDEALHFTSQNASLRLLTVTKGRKNISNGIKGLVILQKGEYSHDNAGNTLLAFRLTSVTLFRVIFSNHVYIAS